MYGSNYGNTGSPGRSASPGGGSMMIGQAGNNANGAGNGARYSLMSKLQHQTHYNGQQQQQQQQQMQQLQNPVAHQHQHQQQQQQQQQHQQQQQQQQHAFQYGGAPSPAYGSNGSNGQQQHNGGHSHSPAPLHPSPIGPPHQQHHNGGGQQQQQTPHHLSHQSPSPHPSVSNGPVTAHWQQQLNYASVSRQSNSPHHHARAAHLAARGQGTSAILITDPNRSGKPGHATLANTNGTSHKKETNGTAGPDVLDKLESMRSSSVASTRTASSKDKDLAISPTLSAAGGEDKASDKAAGANTWTTIDMGGMNLKNVSIELFRYTFLTTLYIPHNSLSTLPAAISRLVSLTLLDASSNKLTSLPAELGLLTSLRDLFLFDNHLSSLPAELGTLHQLETLGIEGNPLPETMRALLEKDGTSALIAYLRDSCPVTLPPPEREWITIEADSFPTPSNLPPETFSLLCYNILNEKYATAQMYGYTPSWALAWDYRKELILQEIMTYSADIICLQEVDAEQYEEYFTEHLSQQDYDGVHYPKSRARTMSGEEKRHVDGCAIFFKNTVFSLVEQQLIEFNQIAMRRPDFKKTEDMFNRVMTKDHIAVVTLLEHRASGARLIVANAHLYWDDQFRDVKLVQVAMLMEEVSKIGDQFSRLPPRMGLAEGYDKAPDYINGAKIPTIVCGDFNSIPGSGVYDFVTRGSVEHDHPDFMDHVYGTYTSDGMSHPLALKSAYSHIGELPFTNYTPGFQGVIDYLFYTTNSLSVTGLLGELDATYLSKIVGWPSAHSPSDHTFLLSEFSITKQK